MKFPRRLVLISLCASIPVHGQEAPVDAVPAAVAPAMYEDLTLLPANKLIPAELRSGPGYVVEDPVETDGYFGIFRLRTHHGVFDCHGKEMLAIRVDELRAIAELDQVNKGEAFLKAAGEAVAKPIEATARIIRDPSGSLEKVPHGVAGLFKRAGQGLESAGRAMAGGAENLRQQLDGEAPPAGPATPPKREDPFGYNRNRNTWAAQVKVDPYSSNPVLAAKLDEISVVTFTTNIVAGMGVGAVAAPLAWVGRVDDLVLTEPPAKIRERVDAMLKELGGQPGAVSGFLANPWFTPTLQLRYARAMQALKGVANPDAGIQLASTVESEVQARFHIACLEMLAARKSGPTAYKSMVAITPLPAVIRDDGSLLVAAPLDVLPWLATTEAFAARADAYPNRVLLAPTQTTARARDALVARGWKLE